MWWPWCVYCLSVLILTIWVLIVHAWPLHAWHLLPVIFLHALDRDNYTTLLGFLSQIQASLDLCFAAFHRAVLWFTIICMCVYVDERQSTLLSIPLSWLAPCFSWHDCVLMVCQHIFITLLFSKLLHLFTISGSCLQFSSVSLSCESVNFWAAGFCSCHPYKYLSECYINLCSVSASFSVSVFLYHFLLSGMTQLWFIPFVDMCQSLLSSSLPLPTLLCL